ncbi:DNA starvation/stationary phase protection protein [Paenalkalicoccus suaedae]|uniref:DNA starvation/stationary phase protection protein n=1 Tax=Paenalkalicoccus suaedae TaxID=2592382 RepID=A0A859FEP4_9BACI|nr:Dps family protein [Paenalkalicoccus suaedae]QKS71557.1 DNA starvation/stationary phase protection protein [Paenalkalicoccus suaedae]
MAHKQTSEILNRHVSNWNIMFVKLHNYHWNVKGHHFFTLHEKFEELYNESAEHIDELAERLLALKGRPAATMKQYLEIATIEEADGEKTSDEMVHALIDDFTTISDELKRDIETLEDDADDEATADMLIAIRQSVEKHRWMLRAFVGE